MSWKPEVKTPGDKDWHGNALRFETHTEAEDYVSNLGMRWTSVQDTRVVEVNEPVNYVWVPGYGAQPLPIALSAARTKLSGMIEEGMNLTDPQRVKKVRDWVIKLETLTDWPQGGPDEA